MQSCNHMWTRVVARQGLIGCLPLLLACCGSNGLEPELGAANESAIINQDGYADGATDTATGGEADGSGDRNRGINEETRLLTVYLQLDSASGFQPIYADRIVTAQPVIPIISEKAEGRTLVQGVPTVVVGSSCEELLQQYPQLPECNVVNSMEVTYGGVESTATTDQEGFASLEVGPGNVRVLLASWPTIEDEKCHWSGSAIAEGDTTTVAIPMLVFCE